MTTHRLAIVSRTFCRSLLSQQNIQPVLRTHLSQFHSNASKPTRKSNVKWLIGSAIIGGALTAGYLEFKSMNTKTSHMEFEDLPLFTIDKVPDVKITRKIVNSNDKTNLDLVLFQYQSCPFCCKVRAFLDAHGFTYSVVEVDAVLRQATRWSPYRKVPMLLARNRDGRYVQLTDSSMIVSVLASFELDPKQDLLELASFYPNKTYFDDNGRKKQEVMNKYFLMYQNGLPKGVTSHTIE